MTTPRVLTAIAATITLLATVPCAAYADRTSEHDVRGDAPAHLDVTKVDFQYAGDRALARIHVADLQRHGEFVLVVMNNAQDRRYGLAATGQPGGHPTTKYYSYRNGVIRPRRCSGADVRWSAARDVVTLSFPERCFRPLGQRVLMAVGSTQGFPDGRTVDDGPVSTLHAPDRLA